MNTSPGAHASHGLASRLLAGQSIVLVAGALTAGLVATIIGQAKAVQA